LLNENITKVEQSLNNDLKLLQKSKTTDLSTFIKSQISKRQQSFEHRIAPIRIEIETKSSDLVSTSINRITYKIDAKSSLDGLSTYINTTLKDDIVSQGESMVEELQQIAKKVNPKFASTIKDFQKSFEEEFRRLNILPIKLNVKVNFTSMKRTERSANIGPVATLISEELSKENWAIGGGMAAGATIGTAICPGIGTAIGFFLGGLAGGAISPDVNEVEAKVKSKLSTPLQLYFNAVANDCLTDFNAYICKVNSNIASEIYKYEKSYRETINRRISQWKSSRIQTTRKIKEVRQEIAEIQSRRFAIQSIIKNI